MLGRESIKAQLAGQRLSDEALESIRGFAKHVRAGLGAAEVDFERRRQVIELLQVEATMGMEDGAKYVRLQCVLGEHLLSDISNRTSKVMVATQNLIVRTRFVVHRHGLVGGFMQIERQPAGAVRG